MKFVWSVIQKPFRFIRRHWKLTLLVVVLVAGAALILHRRAQAQNKPLTYIHPEYRDLVKTLDVSGVVNADQDASMRFAAGGKLTYIGAKEGEVVKKGQVIATIDQRALQNTLQQNLDAYTRQRLDFDQAQKNLQDKALTDQDNLNQQKNQLTLNDTVLNVQLQDISITNSKIAAPFTGVLVALPTNVVGVNLLATDAFEIINPETLIFEAGVDEADISQLKMNDPASIVLDAYRDAPIQSQVSFISYKSQQTSSSNVYVVKFPIAGGADVLSKYRLGMNGDVTITLDTKNHVLSVPIDATRQRDGKTYVDVKAGVNSKVEKEIQAGLETDDYVEVVSGLTTDDQVVLPQPVASPSP